MNDLNFFYKTTSDGVEKCPVLLFAASEQNADMRWLGGVSVPDPFIALVVDGVSTAVVNALEFGRVRREGCFDAVLPEQTIKEAAAKRLRKALAEVTAVEVIAQLLHERGLDRVRVAADFPAAVAFALKRRRVQVECAGGLGLFPQRIQKTPTELAAIRRGNAASAAGLRAAESLLRAAQIRNGQLYYGGKVLTSERVRFAIEVACLEKNAVSSHVIVAGGRQACDPHALGQGPLRAHELIIIDIFPRLRDSGYHGDMTRTFLRGKANDAQRALVGAVREAQRAALATLQVGISGSAVHAAAAKVFEKGGWQTRATDSGYEGFIHSTGHGLGLDVHEAPSLRPHAEDPLLLDAVVTVEPGLYYPAIGGARIEDVARIKEAGYDLLSRYPYRWEIRA